MERTRATAAALSEESALPELASVESGRRVRPRREWVGWRDLDALAMLAGVMFLPAVMSALAERYRLRSLKALCNGALGLMGSVGLLAGSLMLLGGDSKDGLFTLPIGLALLSSSICLRHREEFQD